MALSANALTTVAALETALDLSGTGTTLELYINAASEMIEQYVGRKLARATVTERVKGYGSERIHLSRTPIESITSIAEDRGDTVLEADVDFEIEDRDKGSVERLDALWPHTADVEETAASHRRAGFERATIEVVYVGGYALAADRTGSSNPTPAADAVIAPEPYDLELACLELATLLYRTKGRNLALTGKQVGNASEQYGGGPGSGAAGIPQAIADKLDAYRRVR